MSYEEPIEYVPATTSQSVVWKICRNLAVLAILVCVAFAAISDSEQWVAWALIAAISSGVLLFIGLAFRR